MTIRVVLVDDDRRMHEVVSDLMQSAGDLKTVATFTSEPEAKLWLQENPGAWDLAVVDLVLEAGTGMGVVSQCKSVSPESKVVVLSSFATPGIEDHCRKLGASAVFPKASNMEHFLRYCSELG